MKVPHPHLHFTRPHSLLCPVNLCGAWMGAEGLCGEAAGRDLRAGPRAWLRMFRDYRIGMTGWEASRRE